MLLPKLPPLIREKALEIERLAEARARQGATVDQGSVGGGDGDSETVLPRRLDDTKGAVGLRSALNRAVLTAATRWRFAFLRLAMIMAPAISSNTTNTTNIPNTRNVCAVAASGNLALSLPRKLFHGRGLNVAHK